MKKYALAALVSVLMACHATSQGIGTKATTFNISSEILGEERRVWVSAPKYYEAKDYSCHTLYLLDGDVYQYQAVVTAIRDQLYEQGGYIQPLLIVGIEQRERSRELSPYSDRGEQFLSFIEKEVVPFVDSLYRTEPYRIISGHSLGGIFSLYAWSEGTAFNSCFAFSPAIYNRGGQSIKKLNKHLSEHDRKGVLYVNHGTEGTSESKILEYIDDFRTVLEQHSSPTLDIHYRRCEGFAHNFTITAGMVDALQLLYDRWGPPDTLDNQLWEGLPAPDSLLAAFYKELSGWAGFPVQPKAIRLYSLAQNYQRLGQPEMAMTLANWALEVGPDDPFALMVKGDLLLAQGQKDEAKQYYEKAVQEYGPTDVIETSSNLNEYEDYKELLEYKLEEVRKE